MSNVDLSKKRNVAPSMAEIRKREKPFLAVSTFSGAGGSCLGYKMAGFRVPWASEFIESARETYQRNHDGRIDPRDIRDVKPRHILDSVGVEKGEIDLLDGSPPCADFSSAGTGSDTWGEETKYSETTQRVDDLFFEYARILEGLKPKTFVAENVKGLAEGKSKGYFKNILTTLRSKGYRVRTKVLDAQYLHVPQRRKRLIFVGVRKDLGKGPRFPEPEGPVLHVSDVCPWIKQIQAGSYCSEWMHADRPMATLTQSDGKRDHRAQCRGLPFRESLLEYPRSYNEGEVQQRQWAIPELKRLQGFPDDFELTGSYAQRWERVARTVPPVMMREIASTIRTEILER